MHQDIVGERIEWRAEVLLLVDVEGPDLSLADFLVGFPVLSLTLTRAVVDQSTECTLFGTGFTTDVTLWFNSFGLRFAEAALVRCLIGDFRRVARVLDVVFRIVGHLVVGGDVHLVAGGVLV